MSFGSCIQLRQGDHRHQDNKHNKHHQYNKHNKQHKNNNHCQKYKNHKQKTKPKRKLNSSSRINQSKPKQTLPQEETYRWPTTAQLLTKTRTTLVTTTRTMEVTSPTQEPGRVVPVATRLRSQPSSEVRLSVEVLV